MKIALPFLVLLLISCNQNTKKEGSASDLEGATEEVNVITTATLQAVQLTDANWSNGVSLIEAGFFVELTEVADLNLELGDELEFAGSGSRVITRLEKGDKYLNVYVSGEAINPDTDGFPNYITLIK